MDLDHLRGLSDHAAPKPTIPDTDANRNYVQTLVARALADMPKPIDGVDGRDGRDGRDADPDEIRRQVESAIAAMPLVQGDPGPLPLHEWDGTKLRFQQADGSWGEWVDLQGPRGPRGHPGGGGGVAPPTFNYFPSGW